MRKFFMAGALLAMVSSPAQASDVDPVDAVEIWKSGCSDFKSGMRSGDFRGWLRIPDKDPRYAGMAKGMAARIYLDGWNTARARSGAANCDDLAASIAIDYAR
ncbi:hypothetical protein AAZU54_01395 [Pseudomonas sp. Je.1.5.c]|uniref:hypothetical protein n=1 Tax=Pseudomonas sp. Je.1.5.c TaxID=3142839 RepID=UPI003DAA012E